VLRNAVAQGQLPADLDTARAASVLHAFVGGALRDMLFLPEAIDVGIHARQLVESLFDALRYGRSLRTSRDESAAG
jgi:TetR/AcrR family acrAB operon transcriptional repressor